MWVRGIELASCHPSGAQNFEVVSMIFLKILLTPAQHPLCMKPSSVFNLAEYDVTGTCQLAA